MHIYRATGKMTFATKRWLTNFCFLQLERNSDAWLIKPPKVYFCNANLMGILLILFDNFQPRANPMFGCQ
jgi:hypothetical protein